MEVLRIVITAWTASFRYPIFIVGYQPSLPVPPLSTIYGIISAAAGRPMGPGDTAVGYYFRCKGKGTDIETIYEIGSNLKAKQNICRREILFEPELVLYITDTGLAENFRRPAHPLLLGRSGDLASVRSVEAVKLAPAKGSVIVEGTIMPFPGDGLRGIVQALPTHFSEDLPRRALGTRLFCLVTERLELEREDLWMDTQAGRGVYLHFVDSEGQV
ncbi:CRISPR-associated protein Cas5t [Desulfohalotomaculum tongense]|uniref:type I-B CRISPR-associated protein Cas5b n=1 Tax=Desulforadius tongensis TaxID=1216062 RepID=UPI0019569B5F|nr:CRISPR-associated protein Cas5t [Desulforadius tongensis]